jgi:hypothetical protein
MLITPTHWLPDFVVPEKPYTKFIHTHGLTYIYMHPDIYNPDTWWDGMFPYDEECFKVTI